MGAYNGLYRLGSLFGMLFGAILAAYLGVRNVALALAGLSFWGFIVVWRYIPSRSLTQAVTTQEKREKEKAVLLANGRLHIVLSGLFLARFSLTALAARYEILEQMPEHSPE